MGRAIKAGRVWTNCYHLYPAHAAFGGYKKSGIGRETHKMMLDHYQQTKNLLVSYNPKRWASSKIVFTISKKMWGMRFRTGSRGATTAIAWLLLRICNDADRRAAPHTHEEIVNTFYAILSASVVLRWLFDKATPTCTPPTQTGRSSRSHSPEIPVQICAGIFYLI